MSELRALQEDIKIKNLEYNYAQKLFERSEIKSKRNGIAIFSDKSTLEGSPFSTGQKIMSIADPKEIELLIRVPIAAMLNLSNATDIKFFLNTAPLNTINATIKSVGYKASSDPDGLMTYKIRGKIPLNHDLRIGWKGIAKIHTHRTILAYAIFRRPLISLRKMIGL